MCEKMAAHHFSIGRHCHGDDIVQSASFGAICHLIYFCFSSFFWLLRGFFLYSLDENFSMRTPYEATRI